MLFLIQLIYGYYCAKKLDPSENARTRLFCCIFIGWLYILIYTIKCLFNKNNSKVERTQKTSIDNISIYKPTYKYINHCWNCKHVVTSNDKRCPKCNWYYCPSCGACGCDYKGYKDFKY